MQLTDRRHNNFDFIRIVAALCVILSHQYALSGLPEPSVFNVHSIGGFGVLLFFSISGFLVARSWDSDSNAARFIGKRLLRIWPGLAMMVVLVAFVLGPFIATLPLREYYSHPLIKDYFHNLLFNSHDQLPFEFAGNVLPTAVNGSLWTIPIEVKCYALLGLLGVLGFLQKRWLIAGLTLVVVFFYAVVEPRGERMVSTWGLRSDQRYMIEFGLFFFAGVTFHKFGLNSAGRRRLWILGLCAVSAALAYALHRPFLSLWLIVPAATLILGSAGTPYIRRVGRFGDVSYGLYLYAFPVQQTLIWLLKDRMSWWALLALVLATTSALAFFSWHIVEKRALQLKSRESWKIDMAVIAAVGLLLYLLFK